LCGWFQRLGSCCFVGRVPVAVPAEVVVCLARSLVEGLGYLTSGMLFVVVTEGRLWMAGLNECGLWWRHSGMVGSMMKVVCGSLMDTLVLDGNVGMKGSMMMMTVMVVVSGLCD
jgi:hypothetical protein